MIKIYYNYIERKFYLNDPNAPLWCIYHNKKWNDCSKDSFENLLLFCEFRDEEATLEDVLKMRPALNFRNMVSMDHGQFRYEIECHIRNVYSDISDCLYSDIIDVIFNDCNVFLTHKCTGKRITIPVNVFDMTPAQAKRWYKEQQDKEDLKVYKKLKKKFEKTEIKK